ncbi:mycothiol transferase [Mariniluteicoccus flavus]
MSVLEPRRGSEVPALFCDYLDFYRDVVEEKVRSLPEAALRESVVPSGWTPLELVQHLVFMERRWFVWGFLGEAVDEPWGDNRGAEKSAGWEVDPSASLDALIERLHDGGRRTREILAGASLEAMAPPGPRFEGRYAGETASLAWTCFHVLQEYARHAGHLDIAVELAGGLTGE